MEGLLWGAMLKGLSTRRGFAVGGNVKGLVPRELFYSVSISCACGMRDTEEGDKGGDWECQLGFPLFLDCGLLAFPVPQFSAS